ncbi:MAG: ABC transporter ATP-binding protein [Saprospiraceae bacterium]|nr:ABC transporter ATP-binding protein [Saprospiraceae bacterium]
MVQILDTKQLTKFYGKIHALDGLDLSIEEGMVFGFLGPNGSGKTTTLALLLQVVQPTSGTFSWFGENEQKNVRKKIGAILETPCFYPYLTGYQNLAIAGRIKDVDRSAIEPVLKLVDLWDRKNDPFKTYSLGMKQRLAIASALLSDPSVLILDEPTNGLDPQGIVEIRNLIRRIAGIGKTIILASHLLDEVQRVCSHFMVLGKGQKLYQGSVKDALTNQSTIELASRNMPQLTRVLTGFGNFQKIEQKDDRLIVSASDITTEQLNQYLISHGVVLTLLREKSGNLEEQFLRILAEHD